MNGGGGWGGGERQPDPGQPLDTEAVWRCCWAAAQLLWVGVTLQFLWRTVVVGGPATNLLRLNYGESGGDAGDGTLLTATSACNFHTRRACVQTDRCLGDMQSDVTVLPSSICSGQEPAAGNPGLEVGRMTILGCRWVQQVGGTCIQHEQLEQRASCAG